MNNLTYKDEKFEAGADRLARVFIYTAMIYADEFSCTRREMVDYVLARMHEITNTVEAK